MSNLAQLQNPPSSQTSQTSQKARNINSFLDFMRSGGKSSKGKFSKVDSIKLDSTYLDFKNEAKEFLGERIFSDYARRFAYGIDASCYRYIPKLVIWAKNEREIKKLFALSQKYNIPLSFRASGTSLSGQACSDSVLVVANEFWKNIAIKFDEEKSNVKSSVKSSTKTSVKSKADSKIDSKEASPNATHKNPTKIPTSIICECGVIGADANAALKPYKRKIGPDPATINNALIGGIFSNNSSGMCCGVKQNSYQTIKSIRVILGDLHPKQNQKQNQNSDTKSVIHTKKSIVLDTSDYAKEDENLAHFVANYPHIVQSLLDLRDEILADRELCAMIKRKFAIKNTTGYALNALVDFSEIKDILNHIFIGAEGTLGFVSRVEYECVQDYAHKACALLFYENLALASEAVKILAKNDNIVSAAEIMDYACLMSAASLEGMPSEVAKVKEGNCAILVQLEEDSLETLQDNIATIQNALNPIKSLFGVRFSFEKKEQESWWKIRKALLPLSASSRPSGATVITEDICFEIEHFALGIQNIQNLFLQYKYEGIIFGHALSGNVHFIITPLLKNKAEITKFGSFMEDLAKMVANLQGSIKAEHGTGRMVAPFVELEWGEKAYKINQKIKQIFDSRNLINPDVIITNDKNIHLKNLKPASENVLEDYLDACMECGFCEKICPSKHLSLTPRQRIALYREIKRLKFMRKKSANQKREYKELKNAYKYLGEQTCATCSMCATLCPLEIDTAKIALKLSAKRAKKEGGFLGFIAQNLSKNIALMTSLARNLTSFSNALQDIFGRKNMHALTRALHSVIGTPLLPQTMPKSNEKTQFLSTTEAMRDKNLKGEVVYFTSCLNRIFAPKTPKDFAKTFDKEMAKSLDRPLQEVFESLCKKAGFGLVYPKNIQNLCCGKAYKNHKKEGKELAKKAYIALKEASQNGKIPIVCDHSACSLEMLKQIKDFEAQENLGKIDFAKPNALRFYDLPAFVNEVLLPHLEIVPYEICLNNKRENSNASENNAQTNAQEKCEKIAIYAPCGSRNLSVKSHKWEESIFSLANACGANIAQDLQVKCCGFAGNKGFITPSLNESALKYFGANYLKDFAQDFSRDCDDLYSGCASGLPQPRQHYQKDSIFSGVKIGFSSSSTCEIGLAKKSGFEWRHIIYLVDICAK